MISSFFSKTKPVNYLVLVVLLLLLYGATLLFGTTQQTIHSSVLLEALTFVALLGSLFSINHIVHTQKVTHSTSYALLFFVLLFGAFPKTLFDKNAIFANFFLLLAFRRTLAVKTTQNLKHNLFDASFCIGIASLFYDWALLFLLFLFAIIQIYAREKLKSWLVPFVGLATLFILVFTVVNYYDALAFFGEHYQFSVQSTAATLAKIIHPKNLIYLFLMVSVITVVFARVRKLESGKLIVLRVLFLAFILGTIVTAITPTSTSLILITFFPAAVFLANYLEALKKNRLRETILDLCILVALLLFTLQIYQ